MFRIVNYSSNIDTCLAKECGGAEETAGTVFAITKDENEAKKAERIAKSMHSGDIYSAKLYRITCVDPDTYPASTWKRTVSGGLKCPICGHELRNENHTHELAQYCLLCGTRMSPGLEGSANGE